MVTYSEAGVDISLEEKTVKALTGELMVLEVKY